MAKIVNPRPLASSAVRNSTLEQQFSKPTVNGPHAEATTAGCGKDASQALEINPDFGLAFAVLGEAQAGSGRWEEAIVSLERAFSLGQTGWYAGYLGCVYVRGGRKADAVRLLNEMEEKRRVGYASAFGMALIATLL